MVSVARTVLLLRGFSKEALTHTDTLLSPSNKSCREGREGDNVSVSFCIPDISSEVFDHLLTTITENGVE